MNEEDEGESLDAMTSACIQQILIEHLLCTKPLRLVPQLPLLVAATGPKTVGGGCIKALYKLSIVSVLHKWTHLKLKCAKESRGVSFHPFLVR